MPAKRKSLKTEELSEAIHTLTLQMLKDNEDIQKMSESIEDLYKILDLHQSTITDLLLSFRAFEKHQKKKS